MKAFRMQMALRTSVVLCGLVVGLSSPLSANLIVTTGGTAVAGNGVFSSVAGATTITFNGLNGHLLPKSFADPVTGPAHYSVAAGNASVSPFVTNTIPGSAAPPDDLTTYLSVSTAGVSAVDINFSTPISYFGLYVGSPDSYNYMKFTFYQGTSVFQTVSGSNLFGVGGDRQKGVYFNFTGQPGESFDKIRIYSTGIAFETDNHAYKTVPDGGMTLMLLGGALLGLESLRRRYRI